MVQALLVPVGEDTYALSATTVREIIASPGPTRIPTAPASMTGVFNLRGEVVPLFDTAALLGVGRIPSVAFVVVVATAGGPAGLMVSGLPRVVVLEGHASPSELRGTVGMYLFDGGVAVLLDVEALLLQGVDATGPAAVPGPVT